MSWWCSSFLPLILVLLSLYDEMKEIKKLCLQHQAQFLEDLWLDAK